MSYTTPDFADDVIRTLSAAGYSVNECETGAYAVHGGTPVPNGETRDTEFAAWVDALEHLTARKASLAKACDIAMSVMQETAISEGLYAMPITDPEHPWCEDVAQFCALTGLEVES